MRPCISFSMRAAFLRPFPEFAVCRVVSFLLWDIFALFQATHALLAATTATLRHRGRGASAATEAAVVAAPSRPLARVQHDALVPRRGRWPAATRQVRRDPAVGTSCLADTLVPCRWSQNYRGHRAFRFPYAWRRGVKQLKVAAHPIQKRSSNRACCGPRTCVTTAVADSCCVVR